MSVQSRTLQVILWLSLQLNITCGITYNMKFQHELLSVGLTPIITSEFSISKNAHVHVGHLYNIATMETKFPCKRTHYDNYFYHIYCTITHMIIITLEVT